MKLKFGTVLPSLALIVGLVGCVTDDDDRIPARRAGFRAPASNFPQSDIPPIDPLGIPPGPSSQDNLARTGGSAVIPPLGGLPDPVPQPVPPPISSPASAPDPGPAPQPTPPPQPKVAAPEYAKRVPGKPGWIKSPYDGKILDATGFPPGTEVKDPQTGKIMLVP